MLRYFRSVNSLAKWQPGKSQQTIPSEDHATKYVNDVKEGRGFPSLWLPRNHEDLEKISLGILLKKGHLDHVNLVGFDQSCFSETGAQLVNVEASEFPIPVVRDLHYELTVLDDEKLRLVIEKFIQCSGDFKRFIKANPETNNMRKIAAKHLSEVSEEYREKAKQWGEIYLSLDNT